LVDKGACAVAAQSGDHDDEDDEGVNEDKCEVSAPPLCEPFAENGADHLQNTAERASSTSGPASMHSDRNSHAVELAPKAPIIDAFPFLETEVGDEFYHRDDRYFGTRQGDAPSRADDFRRSAVPKKDEAGNKHEADASNATNNKPGSTASERTKNSATRSLAEFAEILVVLQLRHLVVALILHWSAREPTDVGESKSGESALAFFSSIPDGHALTGPCAIAQDMVALYRLIMFRDWAPDWWPSSLVSSVLGAPLTFSLGGAMLPALLTPLLAQLMTVGHLCDAASVKTIGSIRQQLVVDVCGHLAVASTAQQSHGGHQSLLDARIHRRAEVRRHSVKAQVTSEDPSRSSVGVRGGPLDLTDFEIESRCCLPWAQWVTRIVVMCVPAQSLANDSALPDLFRAWLGCLSSSDLRLKQHAASELAAMLSTLVDRQAKDVVAACLNQLPLSRLHHLASWRLVREADDHPIVSRYLQAVIDLVATARTARMDLGSVDDRVAEDWESARLSPPGQSNQTPPTPPPTVATSTRFALSLGGEGSMIVGTRDVQPPWTAEFFIYRHDDDGEPLCFSTSTADDGELQWVPAICLATTSSTGHTIRLQKGGALFPENSEARKFCVGGATFDYEVPLGRWVHIALVARERSPHTTTMLCGPRAFWHHEAMQNGMTGVADRNVPTSAHRHVIELFADGEPQGSVACRASLPCGLVGLDSPPKTRTTVDASGMLRAVSDEGGASAVLRRRWRDCTNTSASSGCAALHSSATDISATKGAPLPRASLGLDDDDEAHLVIDEGGACAVRSPRCYLGYVRYWSIARTGADIKRYMAKHPPAITSTGLLGSWELAFDDLMSQGSDVPQSAASRFAFDSTEQNIGCGLRGDATWKLLPASAQLPELLLGFAAMRVPDHDTHRDLVLHGTVVRHAVPGVTFGPFCRDRTEALILRLVLNEDNSITGVAEWYDRRTTYLVRGSLLNSLSAKVAVTDKDEDSRWGDELQFELTVEDTVLGSDDLALNQRRAARELVRYDDERSLDNCCIVSPRGAVITGRASIAALIGRKTGHDRLADPSGEWTGEIEYAPEAIRATLQELEPLTVRESAQCPTCHVDEATLSPRLALRPVYGDYARTDADLTSARRLVVSSTTGGHFVALGTIVQEDCMCDGDEFPPLPPILEQAKRREGDVRLLAGELTVSASIAAREAADELMACAASLDGAADDKQCNSVYLGVQKRVRAALDLAVQAASARRIARRDGLDPISFDEAAERLRRRKAGPKLQTQLDSNASTCRHSKARQNAAETAAAPLSSPLDDRTADGEALPDDASDDQLRSDSGDKPREDDDKEDKVVLEETGEVGPGEQRQNDRARTEKTAEDVEKARWWGVGAQCGKWCWEWDIRRVSSGDFAVGIVGKNADSSLGIGSDGFGWAYKSTGFVVHGGNQFVAPSFGPGDIVGVEVEVNRDSHQRKVGRIRFFKNGTEVAAPMVDIESGDLSNGDLDQQRAPSSTMSSRRRRNPGGVMSTAASASAGSKILDVSVEKAALIFDESICYQKLGLRAAAQSGGAGDAAVLLGLKKGLATRHYAPSHVAHDGSDGTHCVASYSGDWGHTGVRHGAGILSYNHCDGSWVGPWVKDKQHGVHLWIEKGTVTPVLFERGERVRAVLDDADAPNELAAYHRALSEGCSEETNVKQDDVVPGSECPEDEDIVESRDVEDTTKKAAPWTLRVVYQQGATARKGIEIDSSEVVRRVAVGEELEATERAVTADGVPRYKVRLCKKGSNAYEYGWISEHLRGGARDAVCVVLRHVVGADEPYLRYRVARLGGAMIRATSSLDGKEVGLAPQSTALWVAERLRLANETLRLRIVAPKRWVGWASEKEHIVRREPTRHELAQESRTRERVRQRNKSRESTRGCCDTLPKDEVTHEAMRGIRARVCNALRRHLTKGYCVTPPGDNRSEDVVEHRAASSFGSMPTEVRVTGTFRASRRSPFLLDRRQCASSIDVSSDLLTATGAAPRAGRGLVLGTKRMRKGLHYWEVRVEQATWGSVFVGVAAHGDVVGADANLADSTGSKRSFVTSDAKSSIPSRLASSHGVPRHHNVPPRSSVSSSVTRLVSSRQVSSSRSLPSAGWGGLGFVNYRATQAFGAEALYGSYIGPGDVVGVLLDADKGTISFVKDGDDFNAGRPVVANLGVAFSSIWRRAASRSPASKAGLYACLGVKGEGDRLSLAGCKSWSSLEDPQFSGVPPRLAQLETIVNALVVIDSWRAHARLLGTGRRSPHFRHSQQRQGWRLVTAAADRIHRCWRSNRTRAIVASRALCNVELDTSTSAIIKVAVASGLPQKWVSSALHSGASCRLPQGEVRVVGVARGHVWFAGASVDEGRAWYWTSKELQTLAQSGAFILAPPYPTEDSLQSGPQAGTSDEVLEKLLPDAADDEGVSREDAVRSVAPSLPPTSAESALLEPFDFSTCDEIGEEHIDASLATIVDTLAARLDVPPALVPASSLADVLGLDARDGGWYVTKPESLRGVAASTISRRFALIVALNDAVRVALPYVDLGRGDLALAELGDLEGGIVTSARRKQQRDTKALLDEASDYETYLRTLASATSYYGTVAATKLLRHGPRLSQTTSSKTSGSAAMQLWSWAAGFDALWPSLSKCDAGGSLIKNLSSSGGLNGAAMSSLFPRESCLSWGPDSWWAGAVPPRSEQDLECCARIPALDALVRPAARSWTGGRSIIALRDRLFFRHVKYTFWAQVLSATTTFTSPPPDEYDRPDELREFQVNRLRSTRSCFAAEEGSTPGLDREGQAALRRGGVSRSISTSPTAALYDEDQAVDSLLLDPTVVVCRSVATGTECARAFEDRVEKLTVFGQLRAQMRSRCDARALRRAFVHVQDGGQPRAFYVKFIGEGVDDHGGPYRAIFQSALVDEPKSPTLSLLTQAASNELVLRGDSEIRDVDDELYRHFGRLLGVAGRHRVPVDLGLSQRGFWRALVAQSITVPHSTSDALDADESALVAAQWGLYLAEDDQAFRAAYDNALDAFHRLENRAITTMRRRLLHRDAGAIAFAAHSSAIRGAAALLPTPHRNSDNHVLLDRLTCVCNQLAASRRARARALVSVIRGAAATVPVELFALFDAVELEEVMCGSADVSVDELKSNARYEGVEPDEPHIGYFWEALESFDTRELSAFIEFCSGSARPPRGDNQHAAQCLKITPPPPGADEHPDDYLPLSQTCFFSLSLPRYSSATVCARKLRYASENARLMDADFLMRHSEGWDTLDS